MPAKFSPFKRVSKVFEQIEKSESIKVKPNLIVIANGGEPHLDASFFYFTGFPYGLFEGSFLLAAKVDGISVFTSPLEESIARSNARGIEIYAYPDQKKNEEKMKQIAVRGARAIGVNAAELTYKSFNTIKSIFKGARIIDVGDAISAARAIKDESEIEAIQKACRIASNVYPKIPDLLKDGITESEVAAEIAYEMQKAGGLGVSFDTIVAFGRNSAQPHYSAGQTKLKKSDFVLLDYGTKYHRYCSDITRTLTYGRASKEQRRIYEIVQEALQVGTENCIPTNTGSEVHLKVASVIDSTEYKGKFIHSTGHSLGLAVHDGPALSKNFKSRLEPGMVVTVEPGIYVPSLGGVRIEDDVLITKDRPKVLTSATRKLIEA